MPRTRAEIGAVGLPLFAGKLALDYNKNLRGAQAVRVYREMLYDEPAATALFAACQHLLRTDVQVQPGGPTDADKRAAELVEDALGDLRGGLAATIRQMYSMIWAGWDVHEVVYRRRPDGAVGWGAWALRRQDSLDSWGYDDATGEVRTFVQRPAPSFQLRTIPLRKCVHLVADDSEGSPEGRSMLRGMYRQWFFCKNVELLLGISLERFGTGIAVFEQEDGPAIQQDSPDLEVFEDVFASLRQNENAGIVVPKGWKFRFAPSPGLDAGVYLQAIQRFRTYMLQSALADFIMLGTDGGAYSLGKDKTELFLLALNGMQERLLSALNRQAVPRLLAYNPQLGALTAPPTLTIPAVKRYDLEKIGGFAETLARVGALHVTPEDEAFFRRVGDLVDVDPAELEELFSPQAGAPAGGGEGSAAQIFGYHLEQGVVDLNEARTRLGLPPRADVGTDLRYREKLAALKVAQQAVAAGYALDVALAMAGLDETGELLPPQPLPSEAEEPRRPPRAAPRPDPTPDVEEVDQPVEEMQDDDEPDAAYVEA